MHCEHNVRIVETLPDWWRQHVYKICVGENENEIFSISNMNESSLSFGLVQEVNSNVITHL